MIREQFQATSPGEIRPIERPETVHQEFESKINEWKSAASHNKYKGLTYLTLSDETERRMTERKLVKIGEPVILPTISEFLNEMATRQHDEIQRLKSEAQGGILPDPTVPEEHHEKLTPDPWQLHPVRIKKLVNKNSKPKKAAKASKRVTKPVAKKSVKARKPAKTTSKPKAKKKSARKTASRSRR